MMVASLYSEVFRFHHLILLLWLLTPLVSSPKTGLPFWLRSPLSWICIPRIGLLFTGQGKGLIGRKGLKKLQKMGLRRLFLLLMIRPLLALRVGSQRSPSQPPKMRLFVRRKRRSVLNASGHPRPLVPKRARRRGRSLNVLFILKMRITSLGPLMLLKSSNVSLPSLGIHHFLMLPNAEIPAI